MKFFSHGILGMNARNLKYIRAKNSVESISLADSKLKTKAFLWNRWIPFAETYAILKTHQELKGFSLSSIRTTGFVVKPNKWSGWRGILIVKKTGENYLVQDEAWTEDELKLHMTDILHGSFSLQGASDSVVIEELLVPWIDFSGYCRYGLADIRIIVYNYVPITAMIRMPTARSEGKANLAQWWIGLGLNIADGQVTSLFHDKTIHVHSFPAEYEGIRWKTLPFWNDILLLSSQVQMYTKLGYLALDWVITKDGPKLLEINARAGLEIQNVNLVPLASRLRKIEDIQVMTPEKWVEIAKSLFHSDVLSSPGKKILFLKQGWTVAEKEVTVSVDTGRAVSSVSKDIADSAWNPGILVLTSSNESIFLEKFEIAESGDGKIVLWRNDLEGCLIDPTEHFPSKANKNSIRWTAEILELDQEIYRIGKKINLSSLLKPSNYFRELDSFVQAPHGYNPVFEYWFPNADKIESIKNEIEALSEKADRLKESWFPIAELYVEKLSEIASKARLVEAYGNEDFEGISHFNTLLFWATDQTLLTEAKEKVLRMRTNEKSDEAILWKILSLDEIVIRIDRYFRQHSMKKIPVMIESGNLSRMSVSYGKEVKIHISRNAIIRENEIDPILAHEIGTHFQRYLAGMATGLKLFQYGTGFYLSDEEGLAIYRSFVYLPEGYEKNAMYVKYYLLAAVDSLSFANTVEFLISLYPEKPIGSIFSDAVRLKRGIIHSGTRWIEWTTYQKDKIYLDGYDRIKTWIESGGNQEKLFFGKVKIRDISILETF